MRKVASLAGVSVATVSRFLNGTARVSDAKRTTLENVIGRLNFKPNMLAQGLKMGSSRTIGVLTPPLGSDYRNDMLNGIDQAMSAAGYAPLIVSGHRHADDEVERIELLIARRVDGLVILTDKLPDQQILGFSARVPIVAFGRELNGANAFGFGLDNYQAACELAEYLICLGHRSIAFIAGPGQADAAARLAGYLDTLARHGIDADPGLIVPGDWTEAGGVLAVSRLLESGRRFSAIFAANDLAAYGARLALYRRSIRVPEDISIVGFDDLHSSMYATPPLTTVHQPLCEAGRRIGEALLMLIDGKPCRIDIPPMHLVVRESVRRI
ncbi:substrate-binding domain-containing protein [Duganella sp. FT92W]|uniref:Substrate-binding domain-containing protein n=2 Tax=Pseudoduganella rivuli TaxID=2666085 RepID=A0A7X2IMN7_9BURK|nr:substrate-binding domain-containing protein [Pseudoduganella rivuli]